MPRVATMSDVAQEAGVTKTTVSMVFRNKPGVSALTRERILKIARRLDYRPATTRQTRGRTHHGQIGFLMISQETPRLGEMLGGSYLHQMLHGCLNYTETCGSSVTICHMTYDDLKTGNLPRAIERPRMDGLVVRGWSTPQLNDLLNEHTGIPYVLVDFDCHVPNATQVQIENCYAMTEMVEHLLQVGAKQFAVITGDMEHINAQERLAGVQVALARHGKSLDDSLIIQEHGFNQASGQRGMHALLDRINEIDVVICQNDLIAFGAIQKLTDAKFRVPEDVMVTGFDNMAFSCTLTPSLTTVDPSSYNLGQTGARLLLELIECDKNHHLHVKMPAALVVRESTRGVVKETQSLVLDSVV